MGIVISIQQRLARLQAQSMAAKTVADDSKAVSDIAFVVMAETGAIDEVTAAEHIATFSAWVPNVDVAVGAYRTYGDEGQQKLYRCLQAHRTQDGWEPPASPALWTVAGDPTAEWPQWSQPIGSVDAYRAGAKVTHNGKRWISDLDNNTWEPGVFGWTEAKSEAANE